MNDIELTDEYWDCDCEHFYIHPASESCCEICSAVREECPDSRVSEVLVSGYPCPTMLAVDASPQAVVKVESNNGSRH